MCRRGMALFQFCFIIHEQNKFPSRFLYYMWIVCVVEILFLYGMKYIWIHIVREFLFIVSMLKNLY
jgi:predicted neutral ceramidase superfamily lipid hydrolase